ncbi:unnamed protein product [Vitrella brassicaformis CCMP3155]|uniref:Fungal lipase-type domain-containing protein n=1 Tax=Vitrella brassicaformis (strain CCMP3155) TaxID=1169540 RepID=A0A0G4GNY8_VITBC|nr:unnamed protein product [Vitrella brassicaformis CCMP3155]|eukprot:CEM31999.1 unnamed protein product [Vitrella brassicaformis CCMP3155]
MERLLCGYLFLLLLASSLARGEDKPHFHFSYGGIKTHLALSTLVYHYGKLLEPPDIHFSTAGNETIVTDSVGMPESTPQDSRYNILEAARYLKDTFPQGRVTWFRDLRRTDLQVGLTISAKSSAMAVVFRGTETWFDWAVDLKISKKALPGDVDSVYVHEGFFWKLFSKGDDGQSVYDLILRAVREELKKHQYEYIYVTGHSLGGALATLCGYQLAKDLPDRQIWVVSFASPRVGNQAWKDAFHMTPNLEHVRVAVHGDPVTSGPLIRYKHVGDVIKLYEDKVLFFQKHEDSMTRFWWFNVKWNFEGAKRDHSLAQYWANLGNNWWSYHSRQVETCVVEGEL